MFNRTPKKIFEFLLLETFENGFSNTFFCKKSFYEFEAKFSNQLKSENRLIVLYLERSQYGGIR